MPDEMQDLDSFLENSDSSFSTIDPEIVNDGEHLSKVMLDAGFESWGTFINKGVLFQMGECRYAAPQDEFENDSETYVVLTISWGGARDGYMQLVIPEEGVKGAIAYFLALAMGTEPDLENTALDDEGMDAFSELANTLIQQGAQALRGDEKAGGKVDLKLEKTSVVNLSKTTPEAEFGVDDILCNRGQLTIEGLMPVNVVLMMSVSCTGREAAINQTESRTDNNSINETLKSVKVNKSKHRNEGIAGKIPVPVVVVLATNKMRVENVKELAPGSIIEFRKFAGEFLDVCAGNTKFAEGEVVIVNQHFGIQLRKITPRIPPAKALKV